MTSSPGPTEVAAGLVFRNGRLLITQRRTRDHLGGFWEFPGGKREHDESFQECLTRELREETSIEITVGKLFDEVVHQYPEKTVHIKFYVCDWRRNEAKTLECADVAWVTRETLEDYSFPPADEAILLKLRADTLLWS